MTSEKSAVVVRGMLGIGDCIHQRAVLRVLMATHRVWLDPAFYVAMYHDLGGLNLRPRFGPYSGTLDPGIGRAPSVPLPANAKALRITYTPGSIIEHGSILAAQFASCGLAMPARPDFGIEVPDDWRASAAALLVKADRPVMIYRPIIRNTVWSREQRHPDPAIYAAIYAAIRERFYVVSVASLRAGRETIIPPVAAVDLVLHDGLPFKTLAGLFASAALVFANPGFSPILAQAVGTPSITVYGGNESAKTTQRVGAHLAPSLAIEPDHPCDCHDFRHNCDKRITLSPALEAVEEFIGRCVISSSRRATSIQSTAQNCLIVGSPWSGGATPRQIF